MAMYDNKHWLLSHIKNSFISSDDTGMCEKIMLGEDIPKNLGNLSKFDCYPGLESSDDDADELDGLAHSFDIQSDMRFNHRRRSNTAQRLEKMKKEKQNASKVKSIEWRECPSLTAEEKAELFARKNFKQDKENKSPKTRRSSLLSEQIEKCPYIPQYPFLEYAKYDGSAQFGTPTRKYGIFLTMLPPEHRNYPMYVEIVTTAKVQDLIGLVCWKVSEKFKSYKLKESVNHYNLCIAEDDGEVDWDFPSLDPREIVGKFDFTFLALVEEREVEVAKKFTPITVTVHLQDGKREVYDAPSRDVTLKEVLDVVLSKRRAVGKDKGLKYTLEKKHVPGVSLNLDKKLSEFDDLEFCMVRLYSKRHDLLCEDETAMKGQMSVMEAPLYQSYRVYILNKVRAKTEIHLGISGEKVEIDPIQQKVGAKFWARHKAATYDMDCVAACDLTDTKYAKRAQFRLVYHTEHSYKHHDFEADSEIAHEIVQKVNHILELRSSAIRKEYLSLRERKLHRRSSFHLGPR